MRYLQHIPCTFTKLFEKAEAYEERENRHKKETI